MGRSPRPGRVVLGVACVIAVVVSIAMLALHRTHTIVYRAHAADCGARVEYSTSSGQGEIAIHGDRELGPFELRHGLVASLLVLAGPDCTSPVGCEIVEDGVSVAVGTGAAGAICSAATAR